MGSLTAAGFVGFNNAQNRVEKASQKGLQEQPVPSDGETHADSGN